MEKYKIVPIDFTEEFVLNEEHMGELKGWRYYRLEYGGIENSNPEGNIFLPPHFDIQALEDFIQGHLEVIRRLYLNGE